MSGDREYTDIEKEFQAELAAGVDFIGNDIRRAVAGDEEARRALLDRVLATLAVGKLPEPRLLSWFIEDQSRKLDESPRSNPGRPPDVERSARVALQVERRCRHLKREGVKRPRGRAIDEVAAKEFKTPDAIRKAIKDYREWAVYKVDSEEEQKMGKK